MIKNELTSRVLRLDGAMGTQIQQHGSNMACSPERI